MSFKYQIGDKVRVKSRPCEISEKSVAIGDVATVVEVDEDDIYLTYRLISNGWSDWWFSGDNLELAEKCNYRNMKPTDLITISVGGVESEVPLGDVVHAVAILGVTNGYHGARIWKALRKPFDTEGFVEDMDTVVEFRDKQKEALDYFFQPYYDKQQQEKDELKTLIEVKMEEVDALVKQLNQLNQM